MGVGQFAVLLMEVQSGSHISVAALLQVGLKEQALHLAAPGLLLGFDLVEGELKGAAGCEPGLQQSELDSGRRGFAGGGGCGLHIITVLLP